MSILKRVISLLLCIVMLTSVLASCDTDDSHNHETGESTTEQTQGTTHDHTHTPATAVQENYVDSTCTKTGSYDEVVYCSVCHEEISRTQKTVDKKAHDYSEKVAASTYLKIEANCEDKAVYYCSCSCGAKGAIATFTDGEPKGHSYSSTWEKNATHHWHKATCEHTGKISGEAEHNYGTDNICDTCEYDRAIHVSGVTLNFSSLALTVDDVKTLIATIAPNNATNQSVMWTTSKASVVTVDTNGNIIAVGVGTAIITVTTADGNKTAQCTVVVSAKVCPHNTTRTERENEVDSTCKDVGSYDEVVYCSACGDELSRTEKTIPKKNTHTNAIPVHENIVDSTCKEVGSYDEVVYCTECGEELSRVQKVIEKKTTHTEGEAVTENLADSPCKDTGSYDEVVYCSVCDKELSRETKTIAKKATHTASTAVQENVIDSTCKDEGSYDEVVYCYICGHEISRTEKTIDKKDTHTEGDPQQENYIAPTFEEKGSYDEVVYCTACGKELSRTTITIPEKHHTPGETVIENTIDSTCKNEGSYDEVVYCSVCGEELSRVQKAIEKKTTHTEDEAVTENFVDSTCKAEGSYDEVVYCSVCDYEISRMTKAIDKKDTHKEGEPQQENYIAPTFEEKGSYDEVVYCTVCGKELSRTTITIPEKHHTPGETVIENTIDSTCKETGTYDEVVYCTECGEELSRVQKVIEKKTTHTEGSAVEENRVEATCKETGSYDEVVYCFVCDKELSRVSNTIDKKAHVYNKEIATETYLKSDATCTEKAVYYYSCECGEKGSATFTIGDFANHTTGEWVIISPASCTTNGSQKQCCTECGTTLKTETISASHNYNSVVHQPTKTEQGYTEYTCTACKVSYIGDYIDATGSIGLRYSVCDDNKTCIITGIGSCSDTEVYIPATIDGYTVVEIGDWAFECSSLTNINIPDSVTSIGNYAFYCCINLKSITIPDSVTSIGMGAFNACSNLTRIMIPNSITRIGNYVFNDCSNLTSITIPDSVTSIGEYAFCGCSNLASITIPDSVTSIGDWAFYDCRSLTSITIPDGVTHIGDGTFCYCMVLTSITIPNSITAIGESAFSSSYLKDIYYYGTKAEFEQIAIAENGNSYFTNANVHYVVEGECIPGDAVIENTIDSTCNEDGSYDEVIYCLMCGDELRRNTVVIPQKSHTPGTVVIENEIDSTCKDNGSYDEVVYCTDCGEELSRVQKTTEKINHTPGSPVEENIFDSTCKVEGSYDEVIYCTVCQIELSREEKTIAQKTTHTEGDAVVENRIASTCKIEGSYDEVVYCMECNVEVSRTKVTLPLSNSHDYGSWVVTQYASPTTAGLKYRSCRLCSVNQTATIPAGASDRNGYDIVEHPYGPAVYVWEQYGTTVYISVTFTNTRPVSCDHRLYISCGGKIYTVSATVTAYGTAIAGTTIYNVPSNATIFFS